MSSTNAAPPGWSIGHAVSHLINDLDHVRLQVAGFALGYADFYQGGTACLFQRQDHLSLIE